MSSLRTALVALIAPCAALGCSAIFDSSDVDEVRVRAEMVTENEFQIVVDNHSNDVVSYGGWFCIEGGALERFKDGEWRDDIHPRGLILCDPPPAISIRPGNTYVEEQPMSVAGHEGSMSVDPGPGRYRFRLALRGGNDNLLPDEVRISNTFRIQ